MLENAWGCLGWGNQERPLGNKDIRDKFQK